MKFDLYDDKGNHVGTEHHEPNKFGVIQIYHEPVSVNKNTPKKRLVREGYYIPHTGKILVKNKQQ